MERWLRHDIEIERKKLKEARLRGETKHKETTKLLNNGWAGGRLHSTLAGEESSYFLTSNRVLRQ